MSVAHMPEGVGERVGPAPVAVQDLARLEPPDRMFDVDALTGELAVALAFRVG